VPYRITTPEKGGLRKRSEAFIGRKGEDVGIARDVVESQVSLE